MTTVDIWSIGCIFAGKIHCLFLLKKFKNLNLRKLKFFSEMVNGKPLFTGVSENDQLKKIFRIRGTPDDKTYPEIKTLSEWNVINYYKIVIFFSLKIKS